ncbi:MAG: TIGR01777 family oxidoreductase [Myxococcaceae bacterium]
MPRTERFVVRSRIAAPAEEVFAWHERDGAFQRLSPPWDPVEVLERSGGLDVGARTAIRIKVGPVHKTWIAEHTAYEKGRMFRDEQRSGPFAKWIHTHRFVPEADGSCSYEDEVEYALPFGAVGKFFGGGSVKEQLRQLFAYRHRIVATDLARHAEADRLRGSGSDAQARHGAAFATIRSRSPGGLRIAITGASGLVGSALVPYLTTAGHTVLPLVRRSAGKDEIAWDPIRGDVEVSKLEGVDAIIHLAGANVGDGRWTESRKSEIRSSRELGTRTLSKAIAALSRKPSAFISSSAIGYYGSRGDQVLDETASAGDDFLATVCRVWEAETKAAEDAGVRTIHLRTGVVLTPAGGALQKIMAPFKFGAGGRIGSGKQWMSWISIEDLLGLIELGLFSAVSGPMNGVAPNPVTNAELAKTLGHVMNRPAIAPVPEAAIRAALGEMGEGTALASQRVQPAVAERAGFRFLDPELEPALRMLLGKMR